MVVGAVCSTSGRDSASITKMENGKSKMSARGASEKKAESSAVSPSVISSVVTRAHAAPFPTRRNATQRPSITATHLYACIRATRRDARGALYTSSCRLKPRPPQMTRRTSRLLFAFVLLCRYSRTTWFCAVICAVCLQTTTFFSNW